MWLCLCDCGQKKLVRSSHLIGGLVLSCKCLSREIASQVNTTHGRSKSRLYAVWNTMCGRCRDTSNERYGGRGIAVCKRWRGKGGFANFVTDMGEPTAGLSIERKDNTKGYSPANCRWATRKEQARNKRTTRLITFNGQTKPLADWAEELGLSYKNTHRRIFARGWSVERALTKE